MAILDLAVDRFVKFAQIPAKAGISNTPIRFVIPKAGTSQSLNNYIERASNVLKNKILNRKAGMIHLASE